jgi:predicted enzyme related to lactoylglutathione lyase
MRHVPDNQFIHLELHTSNLARACAFYTQLFGWRAATIHAGSRSYLALEAGDRVGGGVVECDTDHPVWLPYVEVTDVLRTTEQACLLGVRAQRAGGDDLPQPTRRWLSQTAPRLRAHATDTPPSVLRRHALDWLKMQPEARHDG